MRQTDTCLLLLLVNGALHFCGSATVDAVPGPQRILIYGSTGSGKSTLAAAISARTGIPWHEVDGFTWQPGWRPTSDEEQLRIASAICAQDRWILDTAYGSWRHVPLSRADLVLALDYPRWVSLARLLRRSIARAVDKRLICNGNTESFRLLFSSESILLWHFRTFASKRSQIRTWASAGNGAPVLRLTSPAATQAWLDTLSPDAAGASSARARDLRSRSVEPS